MLQKLNNASHHKTDSRIYPSIHCREFVYMATSLQTKCEKSLRHFSTWLRWNKYTWQYGGHEHIVTKVNILYRKFRGIQQTLNELQ